MSLGSALWFLGCEILESSCSFYCISCFSAVNEGISLELKFFVSSLMLGICKTLCQYFLATILNAVLELLNCSMTSNGPDQETFLSAEQSGRLYVWKVSGFVDAGRSISLLLKVPPLITMESS